MKGRMEGGMEGRSLEMMLMSTLGQVAALVHQYDRVELLVRMVSVEELHENLLQFARVCPRNEPTQKCLSFYNSMEWRRKCLKLSKRGTLGDISRCPAKSIASRCPAKRGG